MACTTETLGVNDYITLSNEKRVRLRTLDNGEAAPIRELWPHLSARTRYLRFLSVLTTLPDSLLRCLVSTDNCRQQAIVAEHDADGQSTVVGLANLGQMDDGTVEVGLVVRDDWQRQHLGTELALRLMETAERRGVRRFVGHVLHENIAMLKILRNVGEIVSRRIDGRVQELSFVRRRPSP